MKTTESFYFLALIPDEKTCEEIVAFKQQSADLFGSKAALRSPPHITLHMPFKWREDRENVLVERLEAFQFEDFPVEIELHNFDFFPPRVAFVNVVKNETLQHLQKELVQHVRKKLNIYNADYKDRPFHPHITVAFRDLKKAVFPDAQKHFSSLIYEVTFTASGFSLLKHDGKVWKEFRFFKG